MAEHTKGPLLVIGSLIYKFDETDICNRVTIHVQGGYVSHKTGERTSEREREATAKRLADCYNALEGYNPDAVRDVVEALRKAEQVFADYAKLHKDKSTSDGDQKAAVNLAYSYEMGEALARLGGAS